jgi:hypothetical protein
MDREQLERVSRTWSTAARWRRVLVVAVLALAFVCTWRSLAYGVDTLDTAVYIAIPYRFLLGDRPFVDEINPIQTAGIVAQPLVRGLVAWLGGTEGIVYATRVVGLALELFVAGGVWLFLRRRLGGGLAALIAFGGVVLVLRMPMLSYSWFASLSFCAGTFLGALALTTGRERLWPAAGALHALALVCLSTYVIPIGVFALLGVAYDRARRWQRLAGYAAGALALGLLFLPVFLDLTHVTVDYAQLHARTVGTLTRKLRIASPFIWAYLPNRTWFVATLAVFVFALWRRAGVLAALCVCVLPVVLHGPLRSWSSLWTCALFASLAPLLAWPSRADPWVRFLLRVVWAPAFAAGVVTSFSSSSYLLNAGFGMLPGAIVSATLAAQLVWRASARLSPGAAPLAVLVAPVAWIAVLLHDQLSHFNDEPHEQLDTVVEAGPYRGLHTTRVQAALLANLQRDLAACEDERRRVVFYYVFPAGYLMTRMRPAVESAWGITCLPERRMHLCGDAFRANLDRHRASGVVVVKLRVFHDPARGWIPAPTGAPDDVVREQCRTEIETSDYTISTWP